METVKLRYLEWNPLFEREKPYQIITNVPPGCPTSNLSFRLFDEEQMHDVRGHEDEFNLDDHGFTFVKQHDALPQFSKDTIEEEYIPLMSEWLKKNIDDAEEVYVFDWRLRSSDRSKTFEVPGSEIDLNDLTRYLKPVEAVHVDQSTAGAYQRVHFHMGDQAESLLRRRFRIINVWRPISEPIEDYPLAVCDGSSIKERDLICADHVRRDYTGESIYPLYNPSARWYYLKMQRKDEVLVFKTFDSLHNAKAKCCPHVSFKHAQVRSGAPHRESVEIRALVFS
ncbi:hypothetical protein F4677DRAFT_445214 [Hypoxylon crocopeplum]|nr:hypothetical protein F4677DRAFT_445214 [Hypoxylon crocopeplum]